jgi:hypothetical protein
MASMYPGYRFDEKGFAHKMAKGGLVTGGIGGRDSVPAMLTPGEVVLNRKQISRLASRLGIRSDPDVLFRQATRFNSGGVAGRASSPRVAYSNAGGLGGEPTGRGSGRGSMIVENLTVQVPPQFNDTEWAIQQGLRKAKFQMMAGF